MEQIFSYKKSQTESNFLFNIRQTYMLQNFTLNLFTLYIDLNSLFLAEIVFHRFSHSIRLVFSQLLQCGDSAWAPLIPTADTLNH